MNFTTWKFFNLSICEYKALEEDSSPKKEWPEQKSIIDFNRLQSESLRFPTNPEWREMATEITNYDQFSKPYQTGYELSLFRWTGFLNKPTSKMATRRPSKSLRSTPNILGRTIPHWIRRISIRPEIDPVCLHWPNRHYLRNVF